jgi:hypothetical protein
MSLHVGGFGFSSPFQPPLNLRSISGTSARNRGDAKGLAAIAVDSGLNLGDGRAMAALAT